jgi:ubiquinone/menaquinone biosynthesis C-methylase UbiE
MATPGSYDVSAVHRDRDAEISRLAAQAQLGWENEAAALERLGFRDGMSILELGSGPGFVTKLLLERFPTSSVTAVELEQALIDDAGRYLADLADRVTFVQAAVEDTSLPDGAYDAAYARLLYQHLPDPAAATAEVFRVLRAGAPFVIYDIDDAIWGLVDPEVPGYDAVVKRLAAAQAVRGGNRYIGRRLLHLLRDAGFQELELDVLAKDSETLGLEPFLPQIDPGRLEPLVRMGVFTQEEVEALKAKRADFLAADRPFILVLSLLARGRKPMGD